MRGVQSVEPVTHQGGVEGGVVHGDGGVGVLLGGGVGAGVHPRPQARHAPAQPGVAWNEGKYFNVLTRRERKSSPERAAR